MASTKPVNGLSKKERKHDEVEAWKIVKSLGKKTGYHPTFGVVHISGP